MCISERIKQYADYKDISISSIEKKIGASDGLIRKSIAKKSDIQAKWIAVISENYPDIDIKWLLTGKGDMLLTDPPSEASKLQTLSSEVAEKSFSHQLIPLYDFNVAAGIASLFQNGRENVLDHISIPNLSKVDGAVAITGDSMYPLLKSGDIVIYKQIHNFDYINYGNIFIVAYNIDGDDYIVIKYIKKSSIEGYITLVSYNEHHSPVDIPVSSIRAVALVKASIRYNTMG